ncbi:hypothetical protein [Desulfonatronum thiodismutans]|uniref:hypothetical protein n=1 Tax=Desulfonatronum thiodismutans TaxID=159290 RepID=UPI0004ABE81A|nr:hypothetical protein [Desulfonatronum thiodismutans]
MTQEKSKGLFSRLFGVGSSRCCQMEFEEVNENASANQGHDQGNDTETQRRDHDQTTDLQHSQSDAEENEEVSAPT